MMPANLRTPEPLRLSLYIHWPFCASRCPYCDFNSHVRERIEEDAWGNALLREMEHWAARLGPRQLTTIFFGGGTPSLMNPRTVEKLIDKAVSLWGPGCGGAEVRGFEEKNKTNSEPSNPRTLEPEITLEANPTSSEAAKFRDLRAAGVNRLSLGVQSLNDADLAFLGRKHDVQQARSAIGMAAKTFPRFSFDLIYARKNQGVSAWEKELREALQLADGHLSLYELTLEPNTGFAARAAQGEVFQAPLEEQAAMYELTQNIMDEAGLPLYEISNHAKPGEECRHNLAYWEYGEWLGLGPGAHGRVSYQGSGIGDQKEKKWDPRFPPSLKLRRTSSLKQPGVALAKPGRGNASISGNRSITGVPAKAGTPFDSPMKHAQTNIRAPETWLKAVQEKGAGVESLTPLPLAEQKEEALLMGLRLKKGLDKKRWKHCFGTELAEILNAPKTAALKNEGLVEEDKNTFRVSPSGFLKLNAITAALLAD